MWSKSDSSTEAVASFLDSTIHFQEKLNTLLFNEPISSCLAPLERATKIKRGTLMVVCLVIFLGICLFFGYGKYFICNFFIGLLYPAYASIMSVEFTGTNNYPGWLIYWIIYGFFQLVEDFSYHLFHLSFVYYFFKCALLIWLMLPGTKGGAYQLYQLFIRRFILAIEKQLKNTNTTATSKFLKQQ
jgi:receptor expression-enhancing protein 5/6